MHVEDLVLVSVDDHVVEPPDMFQGRVPRRYEELAPRVVRRPDGSDVWVYEGSEITNIALNAVAGRVPEEYGMEPTSFDELRSGTYDVHQRVRDMDANGVWGSMCFASFPKLCGQLFAMSKDPDLGSAMLSAYNDWHIEDWCGSYPDRFIPLALSGLQPEIMAAEVHRVARKGCRTVSFFENPERYGLPSHYSDYWDPFWAACEDEGTVVCFHLGGNPELAAEAPMDVFIHVMPIATAVAAANILWSPLLKKFPTVKLALSEGGIGWVPYFLERADYVYRHHKAWTGADFGRQLPSEVFRERFVTCFIDDPVGVRLRHDVGVNSMCWECDYPHSDSTWPASAETLAPSLEGVPAEEVAKITHLNAARLFHYEPFAQRPPTECTVGALRASAAGVDTSPRRMRSSERPTEEAKVRAKDLAR